MKPKVGASGSVSSATAQGARSHQEDCAVSEWIDTRAGSGWLLAVFDGHRGAATAALAAQSLRSLFVERYTAQDGDAAAALRDVFKSLHELTQEDLSGSTASVVFIAADAQAATLAVLGDSPIAILDGRGRAHFGPDHNVRSNRQERAAAEARGGVYRGGYLEDGGRPGIGLQMARALGDADLARILEREPEVETVALGGQGIVVVGTDGLLSPGEGAHSEQLRKILANVQKGSEADAVVADALARDTGDNVTVIVWRSRGNAAGG